MRAGRIIFLPCLHAVGMDALSTNEGISMFSIVHFFYWLAINVFALEVYKLNGVNEGHHSLLVNHLKGGWGGEGNVNVSEVLRSFALALLVSTLCLWICR